MLTQGWHLHMKLSSTWGKGKTKTYVWDELWRGKLPGVLGESEYILWCKLSIYSILQSHKSNNNITPRFSL